MEEPESSISARYSRYQVSPTDFDLVALAGRGAFGKVWVVRKKNDYSGKVMAMKEMNKQDMISRGYVTHTKQEKDIMATVGSHNFIVDLYFTFHSESYVYIVMEYVPGGHLLSYVMDTVDPWPEDKCQFYGGEILLALEHIHSHNIVYKDLKLENVLLDMDGHVRLTDFGLSAQLESDTDRVHSMSGTAAYLAPEVIDGGEQGHGKSADIWAFGVLMFTILLHESPFYSENLSELFDMILHQDVEWEYYKEDLSPEAFSLLEGLLTKDVEKRLGCGPGRIQEIKDHPFFASMDWVALEKMEIKPFIRPKLRVAERATEQDKADLQSGRVTKKLTDRGEFADFSFVAADYIQHTAHTDPTEADLSSWSALTEEEEEYDWPFTCGNLPFSAVNQIVRYLSILDISRASQVCKKWNKFLWTNIHEIDLSTVHPDLFTQYWHSHISRVLKRPSRLIKLKMNPQTTDDSVTKIPSIVPLETLDFTGCHQISGQAIRNLCRRETNAIRPKKLKFPMLSELDLADCDLVDDTVLEQISRLLPTLKRLNLSASMAITDGGLAHLKRLQCLWRLDLQGLTNLTDQGINQLVELSNLRVLELSGCNNLTSSGVESLRTKAKQLEVLIWGEVSAAVEGSSSKNSNSSANKRLGGLFSKPGRIKSSFFRVSRESKSPERGKSFLPSFKRKKSGLRPSTPKKPPVIDFGTSTDDRAEEEDLLLSPRSKRKRANKAAKEKKVRARKEIELPDKKTRKNRDEEPPETITSPESKRKEKHKKSKSKDKTKEQPDMITTKNGPKEDDKQAPRSKPANPDATSAKATETKESTPGDTKDTLASDHASATADTGDQGPRQPRAKHGLSSSDAGKKAASIPIESDAPEDSKKGEPEVKPEKVDALADDTTSDPSAQLPSPEKATPSRTKHTDKPQSKGVKPGSQDKSTPLLPPESSIAPSLKQKFSKSTPAQEGSSGVVDKSTEVKPTSEDEKPTLAVTHQDASHSLSDEPSFDDNGPERLSVHAKRAAFERAMPVPDAKPVRKDKPPTVTTPKQPAAGQTKPPATPVVEKAVVTPTKPISPTKPSQPDVKPKADTVAPKKEEPAPKREALSEDPKRSSLVLTRRAVFESYQAFSKESSPSKLVDSSKASQAVEEASTGAPADSECESVESAPEKEIPEPDVPKEEEQQRSVQSIASFWRAKET